MQTRYTRNLLEQRIAADRRKRIDSAMVALDTAKLEQRKALRRSNDRVNAWFARYHAARALAQ